VDRCYPTPNLHDLVNARIDEKRENDGFIQLPFRYIAEPESPRARSFETLSSLEFVANAVM
jgi:hypothetical protein